MPAAVMRTGNAQPSACSAIPCRVLSSVRPKFSRVLRFLHAAGRDGCGARRRVWLVGFVSVADDYGLSVRAVLSCEVIITLFHTYGLRRHSECRVNTALWRQLAEAESVCLRPIISHEPAAWHANAKANSRPVRSSSGTRGERGEQDLRERGN